MGDPGGSKNLVLGANMPKHLSILTVNCNHGRIARLKFLAPGPKNHIADPVAGEVRNAG
jgi:hypothetical protein